MKTLLIGGAPSTGKTTAIKYLAKHLLNHGFEYKKNEISEEKKDFLIAIEGKNKEGNIVKIAINSASDTSEIIDQLFQFLKENGPFDVLVSSVRDIYKEREYFFEGLNKVENSESIYEIPLAKISRRNDYNKAFDWYCEKVNLLLKNTLCNTPYNLPLDSEKNELTF